MTAVSEQVNIALFCVGNKLMLDDGLGPAVYEELTTAYSFSDNVHIFDVGCMSLNMISYVDEYDYLITVDAVDGTVDPPGTVYEFEPDDMARHTGAMASLHDLKLIDLFDAAALMGFEAQGRCFGMQVKNGSPSVVTIGLTEPVYCALPLLIDTVLADLVHHGAHIVHKESGKVVKAGWRHSMSGTETTGAEV